MTGRTGTTARTGARVLARVLALSGVLALVAPVALARGPALAGASSGRTSVAQGVGGNGTGHASGGGVLLALGDSLASGYQPTYGHRLPPANPATGLPDLGYPGGYARVLASTEHLRLLDLACPGETTASFAGTPAQAACRTFYRKLSGATSQLGTALSWLRAHRGAVTLVTIDLGANDVTACDASGHVDLACVARATTVARQRLDRDLTRLRSALRADDPKARLVGMTYYDPFLGLAYHPGGPEGVAEAALSVAGVAAFNAVLSQAFTSHGATVADVAGAFATGSLRPIERFRGVPLAHDAAVVCRLTWMCPAPHTRAPDIHPNTAGYARIARAFVAVLGQRAPSG